MSTESQLPQVEADVAVTVITRGGRILAVYNSRWRVFTLPMTKRRRWEDPKQPGGWGEEDWNDAAARAAGDWLAKTFPLRQLQLQLEREGYGPGGGPEPMRKWYRYHVFQLPLEMQPELVPGAVAEWLTPNDFFDRGPISMTGRFIIDELRRENLLPG